MPAKPRGLQGRDLRAGRDRGGLCGSREAAEPGAGGKQPKQGSASTRRGPERCQGSAKNTSASLQNR